MEKNYTVYILRCADDSYYTGITNDVRRRLHEHESGLCEGYTFTRRPVRLVYTASFSDVYEAIHWEKVVKGWRRAKKEALMKGDFEKIVKLSECTNETHSKFLKKSKSTDDASLRSA